MKKMTLFALTIALFTASIWSYAHPVYACKDYFTQCTEGGCAVFDYTSGPCKLFCLSSSGIWREVTCFQPGALGEHTNPTDA